MAFGQDVEVALSLAEDAVVGEVSPRKELSGVLQHCLVAADWPAPWPGADVVVACGQSGGRSRVLVGCGDGGGIGALDGVGLLELGQSLSLGGSLLVASAEPTRGLAAGGLRLRGGANACDQWIECATVGQAHWLYLRADSLDAHLELRRAGKDEYLSSYYRCVGTGECVWGIGDRVGAEVVQPGWVCKTLMVGSDGEAHGKRLLLERSRCSFRARPDRASGGTLGEGRGGSVQQSGGGAGPRSRPLDVIFVNMEVPQNSLNFTF